ncbi:hypothetical protein pb186bvf_008431 [Paramecium bursaria]
MSTDEIVRQQTKEFRLEIERRFMKCKHNHYKFPIEGNDFSDDDSLRSLKIATTYDLNKRKKPASQQHATNRSQEKTSAILLKLLQSKSKKPSCRTTLRIGNGSFYQQSQRLDSKSRTTTSRLRTEGSVLRETTNITISPLVLKSPMAVVRSPKIIKSPTYIQIDSYLNSTKHQRHPRIEYC